MTDRSRHVIVGITALGGVAGFIGLMMLFGYVPDFLEKGYTVIVRMPEAGGVSEGSRVKLSGIDVGRVLTVQLDEPASKGVIINALVRHEFRIPVGVKATVEQALIGGSPALSLNITHLDPNATYEAIAQDGTAEIRGEVSSLTGQLAAQMQSALAGPSAKIDLLVGHFEKLSLEWTEVGKNIKDLTAARNPNDVDEGKAAANIATVLARADSRLGEMKEILVGVQGWLNDAELKKDVRTTMANVRDASGDIKEVAANFKVVATDAKTLSGKLNKSVDKLDGVLDAAGGNMDQLTKRYVAVADDMSRSINAMHKTIEQARTGDGTVGKLLNDPALFNNLNQSAKRMDEALKDLQLLIKKWEKEGLLKF